MPELPDIVVYLEALAARVLDRRLDSVAVRSPFVLRTAEPPIESLAQHSVIQLRRLGKRIAFEFDHGAWLVLHLMIAGRLHWDRPQRTGRDKSLLLELQFESGHLSLTEAGTKRRASVHVLPDESALANHDPGGLEVLDATLAEFVAAITAGNHTLKRSLTSPRILSGIGNSYSDEILHAAQLSPAALTHSLNEDQIERLFDATRQTLETWTRRLRDEAADEFPKKVAAFRLEMAVHGRYGQPCPVCQAPVQRIRYAAKETNYCAKCQTNGKLLSDRSLARLLKRDWPRSIDEIM